MSRPPARSALRIDRGMSIRTMREGTFLAYYRPSGGLMQRRRFPTLDAAQKWLSQMHEQGPLPPLDAAQYSDAQRAVSLLPPGATLEDAARALARTRPRASPRLSEAVSRFLASRGPSVRPATLQGYRSALSRFLRAQGGQDPRLCDVEPERIERFVSKMKGSTRNSTLLALGPLFSFGLSKGWTGTNPVLRVPKARRVEPPLGVFSPDETRRILEAARIEDPGTVPYLAVGFFAGVRPNELSRLSEKNFTPDFIRLDGTVTKTGAARTVPIRENLKAWLAACPWSRRAAQTHSPRLARIRARAGVGNWPHDVMRHSFATYAYELEKDAARIAAEMGHRGTDVFFKHYRALAQPGDGKRYFGIFPG